jgi:hypothetical protein
VFVVVVRVSVCVCGGIGGGVCGGIGGGLCVW